ncbi:hypothetical protein BTO06_07150 [Tenacibaculum sp. SZ-18]|nr:hypothetical protein BTO06_07150 [Tenacibaculum sp. SZ-18]
MINSEGDVYKLNREDTFSYFTSTDVTTNDIAISEEGIIYGITANGLIEIKKGTHEVLPNTEGMYGNSLVYAGSGDLYYIHKKSLYRYNVNSEAVELISNFDLGTPGDLTLYKGNIIFPNSIIPIDGSESYSRILAYNLKSGLISEVACSDLFGVSFGITNVFSNCKSNKVYFTNLNYPWENLYTVDLETGEIAISSIKVPANNIFGLASSNEYLAADCHEELRTKNCRSIFSIDEFLSESTKVYPNPTNDIITVNSKVELDLIEIYDMNGKLVRKIEDPENGTSIKNLSSGNYLVNLHHKNSKKIIKVIKK